MASIYDLKPAFQNLLRPLCTRFQKIGITANQVTIAACLLSVVVGVTIYIKIENHHFWWLLPITLFVRMALNAIDGMLAREFNMKSRLGAILNELGDVIADVALYFPFAYLSGVSPVHVVIFIILSIISEYTGVLGLMVDSERRYEGPLGKSDRAFLCGVLAILIACYAEAVPYFNYVFIFANVLLGLTIMNRARKALKSTT